jgi:hypothetical protein
LRLSALRSRARVPSAAQTVAAVVRLVRAPAHRRTAPYLPSGPVSTKILEPSICASAGRPGSTLLDEPPRQLVGVEGPDRVVDGLPFGEVDVALRELSGPPPWPGQTSSSS